MSLASYLAALDADRLAALLRRRPDVLVDPAPRTVDELAMAGHGRDRSRRNTPPGQGDHGNAR